MKLVYQVVLKVVGVPKYRWERRPKRHTWYLDDAKKVHANWLAELRESPPDKDCVLFIEVGGLDEHGKLDEWFDPIEEVEIPANINLSNQTQQSIK